jgi:hypothetical protein
MFKRKYSSFFASPYFDVKQYSIGEGTVKPRVEIRATNKDLIVLTVSKNYSLSPLTILAQPASWVFKMYQYVVFESDYQKAIYSLNKQ